MNGIVFNLLEEVIVAEHGEDAWDETLAAAGADGIYTAVGTYEDSVWRALVSAFADRVERPDNEVIRWFGERAVPLLVDRFPRFYTESKGTREFVLALNQIIHPEVRKIYPGADVPEFDYDASKPGQLIVDYRSPRQLCAFAEGLILGTAAHYGETVDLGQSECMLRGDERCRFRIVFAA